MSQEKKFYVYVHRYASGPKKGQVFYVGKGSGNRVSCEQNRNDHWFNIAMKYGYDAEVVFRFESEICAFSFEKALISHCGFDNLCNISIGGDGSSGHVSPKRKRVYCSNGMTFESTYDAGNWLGEKWGHHSVSRACITGGVGFGCRWSYDGIPEKPDENSSKTNRPVYCSNGEKFTSLTSASEFVSRSPSAIYMACKAGHRSGGYYWGYEPIIHEPKKVSFYDMPIKCSNGMTFNSARDAAEYLGSGHKYQTIASCAKGYSHTAYGFGWRFLAEDAT